VIQARAAASPSYVPGTAPMCHETSTYHSEPTFGGRAEKVGLCEASAMLNIMRRAPSCGRSKIKALFNLAPYRFWPLVPVGIDTKSPRWPF